MLWFCLLFGTCSLCVPLDLKKKTKLFPPSPVLFGRKWQTQRGKHSPLKHFLHFFEFYPFNFFSVELLVQRFYSNAVGTVTPVLLRKFDAENRTLGNTWKIVVWKASFFLAEKLLPSCCFSISSFWRALAPWAGTFFGTHSYWEKSDPENSQSMIFFLLNPFLLEIQLLHSFLSP